MQQLQELAPDVQVTQSAGPVVKEDETRVKDPDADAGLSHIGQSSRSGVTHPDSGHERAVTTQRPRRSTRSQGQSLASQCATASASGTSRLDLSARTQDCTVTSHFSEVEGYR